MRASRLVAVLVHLQQRGPSTARQLAEQLEVSVRTIYRDVEALQAAGVPLWTEPGAHGGIRLVEGWDASPGGLTAEEASALFLAGAPAAAAELGLTTVLIAAQTKVLATLPPELHARATRVRERFHIDAPDWFASADDVPLLPVVADAVWTARRIDVRYGRGRHPVARRLDPLGLVLKAGTWYLVAGHRGEPRTYRMSRIQRATVRTEAVERPQGFSLAAWWAESSREFDRSMLKAELRIRVGPRGAWLLGHVADPAAAAEALAAAGPADADGWRETWLAVESSRVGVSQLVALGGEVEILEPADARRELAAVGRTISERHATPVTR
jgi:predicted DNA-binding transcriptional regulator YafY